MPMYINGEAHGPDRLVTTCQLHMRKFKDGDTITIEPFRANAFPVVKDLAVDRSAFDRIQHAGGFVSVNTPETQDANAIPIDKHDADKAFDAATCIEWSYVAGLVKCFGHVICFSKSIPICFTTTGESRSH